MSLCLDRATVVVGRFLAIGSEELFLLFQAVSFCRGAELRITRHSFPRHVCPVSPFASPLELVPRGDL